MNAIHILFETNRFNLSVAHDHFINPDCFGEDLASWVKSKLSERAIEPEGPDQEDWGWWLAFSYGGKKYFLAMNGTSENNFQDKNRGEWRIIVEQERSLLERLRGRNKITKSDAVLELLQEILRREKDFRNVRTESDAEAQGIPQP